MIHLIMYMTERIINGIRQSKDVAGKALTEGTDYEVSYDKDNFKDVTTITVTITGKGDYKGTITKKYQITPRPVTLTSATDSKAYDGDPLTNKKVTESKVQMKDL